MKIDNPYKCDVCGLPKGDGNKWLLGLPIEAGGIDAPIARLLLGDDSEDAGIRGYAILDWSEEVADSKRETVQHLCSDKCALTKQSEYLRRT